MMGTIIRDGKAKGGSMSVKEKLEKRELRLRREASDNSKNIIKREASPGGFCQY